MTVLRYVGDADRPHLRRARGRLRRDHPAIRGEVSGRWRPDAGEQFEQFALTVAADPGDGDDFAGADAKADVVDASDAALVAKGQPLGYECRGRRSDLLPLSTVEPDLAADHQFRQFGRVGRGGPAMRDDGAGAHDIDLVGDRHDLAQFVRDQNDRRAARAQRREDTKQLIRLLRRQDAGRLVEDQDAWRDDRAP